MPNIEIIRFNHFTARKSERYTATHNGLYVVEEGALVVHQPNGEQFELQAGDFTLYNSSDLRSAEAIPGENGFKAVALVFDISLFCEFKKTHPGLHSEAEHRRFYPFSPESNSEITQLKNTLLVLASRNAPDYTQSHIAMALLSLMVEVQPDILSIIDDASSLTASQKAIKYIEKNIEKDITLEGLAAHMSMSIATLKRRLAAENLSFSQILKVKRINYAATQLRVSQKSITEIAFESGFKSAAHFSTAFKSIYNITPKDFRNQVVRG
ncbi:TPA: helix-turn-helix domain-containing protein [Vibrio parahaemolyticus]|uniref:helix-turn-helix transcriptional regulator n=1 Tax=Vibrio parahaemolyticus TaxID=670 RepID=UPI00040D6E69|nr:helix-turn-helix domain-containing protein [Vibrio parahaemolyticus]EGQ8145621.1 helix-turn-helix transcriptional regulator [Vibrio parahaemolyticus]EGQ8336507.1 helix-turn-helix domain-containing protein [Vibrio parahaemolyticus]EGQ8370337.1 helix-turn-helix domain-containing protein [Vibrio parahaemolyticus]EGQ8722315.1 helix-turn-helix domain-containing protein [Vibrio parahaemolyticus]EGQ8760153.1 helix-turn-helix domain-containing protein [Vibrio parahaemolyticus]